MDICKLNVSNLVKRIILKINITEEEGQQIVSNLVKRTILKIEVVGGDIYALSVT